jgi:hypothetical protein
LNCRPSAQERRQRCRHANDFGFNLRDPRAPGKLRYGSTRQVQTRVRVAANPLGLHAGRPWSQRGCNMSPRMLSNRTTQPWSMRSRGLQAIPPLHARAAVRAGFPAWVRDEDSMPHFSQPTQPWPMRARGCRMRKPAPTLATRARTPVSSVAWISAGCCGHPSHAAPVR